MANYLIQGETLTNIANAIRAKTGGTTSMSPNDMATAISNISTDGTSTGTSGISCRTGTVTSDSSGVITFPALGFTPTMIAVWNITESEFDDTSVGYSCYSGVMLFAVFINGVWIAQVVKSDSGAYIANATYDIGDITISHEGTTYRYIVDQTNDTEFANTEFNYAIYG